MLRVGYFIVACGDLSFTIPMPITTQPMFDANTLQSVDDVLLALERLGHDLPKEGLARLDNFNRTYLIITRNVRQHLKKGSFDNPEFLHRFDTRFAYYYLRALYNHLTGEGAVPRAWQHAFTAAERRHVSPMVCMALGVNAHVNNDIPQVLRDCRANRQIYPDYIRVNSIIRDSLDEVIDLFKEDRSLSPHHRYTRPFYKRGMHLLVMVWRYTAWRKFRRLERREMKVPHIEDKADTLAKGVRKLPI